MYLGFDLGTTNVKAVVVEAGGRVAAIGASPVERFCTPDGGVEQDIEQIWGATQAAVRRATAGVDASRIRAIGVSSQGGAPPVARPRGPAHGSGDQLAGSARRTL